MAYRQKEKVELGFFQFLFNPAFWLGVAKVGTTLVTVAATSAPKSVAGSVNRPETSTISLFTSQIDVQKQVDEILAKSKAEQEALAAEEQAKKLVTWQRSLWGVLIIVGGIVVWKAVKKRKIK